jgi:hypothetical protein
MWFMLLLLQLGLGFPNKLEGEKATFLRCDVQMDGMCVCVCLFDVCFYVITCEFLLGFT